MENPLSVARAIPTLHRQLASPAPSIASCLSSPHRRPSQISHLLHGSTQWIPPPCMSTNNLALVRSVLPSSASRFGKLAGSCTTSVGAASTNTPRHSWGRRGGSFAAASVALRQVRSKYRRPRSANFPVLHTRSQVASPSQPCRTAAMNTAKSRSLRRPSGAFAQAASSRSNQPPTIRPLL